MLTEWIVATNHRRERTSERWRVAEVGPRFGMLTEWIVATNQRRERTSERWQVAGVGPRHQ
jgi:hypothetical protein